MVVQAIVCNGTIPYVKVSDIRNLRINVNPTNLVAIELARKFWKTEDGKSNLKAWDLIYQVGQVVISENLQYFTGRTDCSYKRGNALS